MSLSAHFLVGPTAVGKTAVAQHLAEKQGSVILSADSMLVYRGMDIGTAKPTEAERGDVTYYGVDLVDPDVAFSVWDYRRHALDVLAASPAAGHAIVTGGSGLYVKSLTHGLVERAGSDLALREVWERRLQESGVGALQDALRDASPAAYEALVDKQNPRRLIRMLETLDSPPASGQWQEEGADAVIVGLSMQPDLLNARIAQRVSVMYDQGLIIEVEALLARELPMSRTAQQAIGYAEAIAHLEGRMTQEQAMERTIVRTRRLGKRQRTWFRNQANVVWVEVTQASTVVELSDQVEALWRQYGPTAIKTG